MLCSCLRTTSKHQKKQVAFTELKICWVSSKEGDTVQDLRRFVNKWDATLASMATTPEDVVLRDIL